MLKTKMIFYQLLVCSFCTVISFQNSFAQIKAFGLKTGVNYSESVIKETFKSNGTDFTYATDEADVGLVWGFFFRAKVRHFFFQPELLSSDYQTKMKLSSINFDSITNFKQNKVDIPLLIGYSRKDKIRAYLGPVYTKLLTTPVLSSEFLSEEFPVLFNDGTWGFQLGFGFDMGRLAVDARYETSLGRISDQVTLKGKEFSFDHRTNNVQITLGWDWVK